jgi:preprotein translocase subunit SecD
VRDAWDALDCSNSDSQKAIRQDGGDPAIAFVTCADDPDGTGSTEKYVLGPVDIYGLDISKATSGPSTTGKSSYEVFMSFHPHGADAFTEVTARLARFPHDNTEPRERFAMVLDGLVISAPTVQQEINGGQAQIHRDVPPMLRAEAELLSDQLRFGALPITLTEQTSSEVTALLGNDQLRHGLLAGIIGLILVVLYSLLQYRALAVVTVGSLVVAGSLTFGSICVLSGLLQYRLSLAGIAGLIVSIGITADSFIVYFERVRDELREGRSLIAAVDHGWERARRTVFASDTVSLLAAAILYVTAVGNVRGFAFTLGLTTVIDLIVITRFTHPMLVLIARTRFFGDGHRLSGLDPRLLGRGATYKGRGRVDVRPQTLAERKAALERGGL